MQIQGLFKTSSQIQELFNTVRTRFYIYIYIYIYLVGKNPCGQHTNCSPYKVNRTGQKGTNNPTNLLKTPAVGL